MIFKKNKKAPLILPVEDHRKATQFVALLFAVCSRDVATRKSKGKTTKKHERVRENIREPCYLRASANYLQAQKNQAKNTLCSSHSIHLIKQFFEQNVRPLSIFYYFRL